MPVHDGGHRSGGVLGVFPAKPVVPGAPAGAGGGAWPVELPDPARHGGDPERQPHPPDARRQRAQRLRRAVHQGVGERCRDRWPFGIPAPGRPAADRARRHRAFLLAQDRLSAVLDAPALRRWYGVFPLFSRRQRGHAQVGAAAGGVHHAPGRGREAGLRARRRQALAGPPRRWRRPLPAGLSRRRSLCLPADRPGHPGERRPFHPDLQAGSHQTVTEYLTGVDLPEHRQTVIQRGRKTTCVYRWLTEVPLRGTADAVSVNWVSIEIFSGTGKRTYHNSFVTDLPITADSVAELAACGRARWKIENETFNVLKGYNLEHSFGHGKQTLANLLVSLNLLAFAFHTAANLCVLAWRTAAHGAKYRFFEHLRTITAYIVFPSWQSLLDAITDPKARPP